MEQEISQQLNIGRIGQYLALVDLLLKGIEAFPTAEKMNYDIVAEVEGRLIKLQVKTTQKLKILAKCNSPVYEFDLRTGGENNRKEYQKEEVNGFVFVVLDKKKVFYLPYTNRTHICLRDKERVYAGKETALYWQDLTWENLLKSIKVFEPSP